MSYLVGVVSDFGVDDGRRVEAEFFVFFCRLLLRLVAHYYYHFIFKASVVRIDVLALRIYLLRRHFIELTLFLLNYLLVQLVYVNFRSALRYFRGNKCLVAELELVHLLLRVFKKHALGVHAPTGTIGLARAPRKHVSEG